MNFVSGMMGRMSNHEIRGVRKKCITPEDFDYKNGGRRREPAESV